MFIDIKSWVCIKNSTQLIPRIIRTWPIYHTVIRFQLSNNSGCDKHIILLSEQKYQCLNYQLLQYTHMTSDLLKGPQLGHTRAVEGWLQQTKIKVLKLHWVTKFHYKRQLKLLSTDTPLLTFIKMISLTWNYHPNDALLLSLWNTWLKTSWWNVGTNSLHVTFVYFWWFESRCNVSNDKQDSDFSANVTGFLFSKCHWLSSLNDMLI